MYFEIISSIESVEIIAVGQGVRDNARLRKLYGKGRWRKLKGIATIKLEDGVLVRAELHWYEATGIGRREMKVKRLLSE